MRSRHSLVVVAIGACTAFPLGACGSTGPHAVQLSSDESVGVRTSASTRAASVVVAAADPLDSPLDALLGLPAGPARRALQLKRYEVALSECLQKAGFAYTPEVGSDAQRQSANASNNQYIGTLGAGEPAYHVARTGSEKPFGGEVGGCEFAARTRIDVATAFPAEWNDTIAAPMAGDAALAAMTSAADQCVKHSGLVPLASSPSDSDIAAWNAMAEGCERSSGATDRWTSLQAVLERTFIEQVGPRLDVFIANLPEA